MEISIKHGEQLVFALKGRLDTITSKDLVDAFEKEDKQESLVVVDMKEMGVTAIGSGPQPPPGRLGNADMLFLSGSIIRKCR